MGATMTKADLRATVLDALSENLAAAGMTVEALEQDPEIDLYRSGICDSFDIVQLILEIEESTGRQCTLANESAEDFVLTLDRLVDSFELPPNTSH